MLARTARPAACALLAVLAGCAEEPSFALGWRIAADPSVTDPNDAPELNSVKQCSEVGIEKVRLEVRGADDLPTDPLRFVHDYGCFPTPFGEGELIDGPALAPGDYELELIGLRRNGNDWQCPGPDVDAKGDPIEIDCVRAFDTVTVSEGALPELMFLLQAPSQCDDGVDNDRDGRVDVLDPACQLGEPVESYDAGRTFFQLSVALLANALVEPRHIGIASFELRVDDELLDTLDPDAGLGQPWPWEFRLLDMRLDPGDHVLRLVALDTEGVELTAAKTVDFSVALETGAFVMESFVLGSADFLAPIEDSLAVGWAMGDSLGASPCGNPGVDDMRVKVRQGDTPLSLGVDDLLIYPATPLANASVEAGDWLAFTCDNAGRLSSTAELTWTDTPYSIEIEGRVGGVTCFTSGITTLRPGSFSPVGVVVSPVLDDQGEPPAGCPK